MIGGSPKVRRSASEELSRELKEGFPEKTEFIDYSFNRTNVEKEEMEELNTCDALVFAFPLYIDGIPSQLLSCLYQMDQYGFTNREIQVFGLVNCGFYEAEQNRLAIELLKNWCERVGLKWGMAVAFGGGGALIGMHQVKAGVGPKKSLSPALLAMRQAIIDKIPSKDFYTTINMPRFVYRIAAQSGWRSLLKKNGGNNKDLGKRMERL